MAEHYCCAVVPARMQKPRDKATAEKAVNLCEAWVLAPLADERLTSLDELNAEVRHLVEALNAHPFSRRLGCRDDAFFGEKRPALNPLPAEPFESCGRRRHKVSPGYHVQCNHMCYSVPYRLVGRTVDVRLSTASIAVLDGGETVAEPETRDSRKIDKAGRVARFKIKGACAEGIYYLPDRNLTRGRISRLASCAWVEARENLVITSESGAARARPGARGRGLPEPHVSTLHEAQ